MEVFPKESFTKGTESDRSKYKRFINFILNSVILAPCAAEN